MKKIISRFASLQVLCVRIIPLLLFSAMVGVQFVNLASANPMSLLKNPDSTPPDISILSPTDNWTYTIKDVHLAFTVTTPSSWKEYYGRLSRVYYIIDGQESGNILGDLTSNSEEKYYYKILTGLSDGKHSVIVYAEGHKDWRNEDSNMVFAESYVVYFNIDTTLPSISILSPGNKTYETTDIPLAFTIDESVSWMAYCLDGEANVTITGNTTLSGLPDGSHNLIVYGTDTAGNTGTSEKVYFSIAQETEPQQSVSQQPPPDDSTGQTGLDPTPLLIAVPVVLVTILGLAFYRRKRNDSLEPPT